MRNATYSYGTLSEAVNDLQKRGYITDFLISEEEDCFLCQQGTLQLSPEEFCIDEVYRFEGMTDPGDESIVYAVSSEAHGIKGLIINSYGADFGYRAAQLVKRLKRKDNK